MQISDADADRKEQAGIILGQEYSKKGEHPYAKTVLTG